MKVARFASHLTSSSQDYELSTILSEIREGKTLCDLIPCRRDGCRW